METKFKRFKKRPMTFRSLTGLSLEKYTELYNKLVPVYEKAETKRLQKPQRQRQSGGGRKKRTII